ncbi:adenyl-nucleotide exchange factor sse1, partial [Cladochytrium tenue]
VRFRGQQREFTATQLTGMFLGGVGEFFRREAKLPLTDCVVACPGWFNSRQRLALRNAAEVAGLRCLRIMNDLTAAALVYGLTKSDLPDPARDPSARARTVVFVDVGHSSCQAAVVAVTRGGLAVRGAAFDRNLGGRDLDELVAERLAREALADGAEMQQLGGRARLRLRQAGERAKRVLSANAVAAVSVEAVSGERDVAASVRKDEFAGWAGGLFERVGAVVRRVLAAARVAAAEIDAVELVGGSTRVPGVKELLAEVFRDSAGETKLSTTLNQDEAVARGCALQCAMLSPIVKVRPFSVQDWNTRAVVLRAADSNLAANVDAIDADSANATTASAGGGNRGVVVFPVGCAVPSTRHMSVRLPTSLLSAAAATDAPLVLELAYGDDGESLPAIGCDWFTRFRLNGVAWPEGVLDGNDGVDVATTTAVGLPAVVRLALRIDESGMVSLESAEQEDSHSDDAEAGASAAADTPVLPTGEAAEDDSGTNDHRRRPARQWRPLVVSGTEVAGAVDAATLGRWVSSEAALRASDARAELAAERRNALEEYVYEARARLRGDGGWADVVRGGEREALEGALEAAQRWLDEDGEDDDASDDGGEECARRLAGLRALGDPLEARRRTAEAAIAAATAAAASAVREGGG